MWFVASVSKIQRFGFLPSLEDDLQVNVKEEMEVILVAGLEFCFDHFIKPKRLWYCSWVKPKVLELNEVKPDASSFFLSKMRVRERGRVGERETEKAYYLSEAYPKEVLENDQQRT